MTNKIPILNQVQDKSQIAKAEALLEALIATTVLMIVLSYGTTVFTGATQNMAFNKDRLIAVSLAQEGIEGIKNIIGSNLMKLSSDKNECWNAGWMGLPPSIKPVDNPNNCANNKIGNAANQTDFQHFRLFFNHSSDAGRSLFRLEPVILGKLELTNVCASGQPVCLTNGSSAAMYNLNLDSNNRYNHENGSATKFYRAISIKYFDNINASSSESNAMQVASRVGWMQGGVFKHVEYATILTKDYAL